MNDTLILFTKKFPFDYGEEFIESELPFLADNFENVVVVATALSKKSVQTRDVPPNVKVYKINDIQNRNLRYVTYIICGMIRCFRREVVKELKKANGIKAKAGVLYIEARTNREKRKFLGNAELVNALLKSNTVLYSYWFSDLPVLMYRLKEWSHNTSAYLISRAHGYDLYAERNITGFVPFRDYVMDGIDMVFPCSENGTQYLKKMYPMAITKIKTAYLGTIDFGLTNEKEENRYHIVTCSAITPIKRVKMLAEALKILESRQKVANICWTCIGDGALFEDLQVYVTNNIRSITIELMGRMSNADVMNYYKGHNVDLFINVSTNEGLPVSIMEAQSFGIPVLATNVGGTSEIVLDGITGKLLPKNINAAALASAIEDVMEWPFDRQIIREFWEKHFNAKTNYDKFTRGILQMITTT